jgi:hypothetical protein
MGIILGRDFEYPMEQSKTPTVALPLPACTSSATNARFVTEFSGPKAGGYRDPAVHLVQRSSRRPDVVSGL